MPDLSARIGPLRIAPALMNGSGILSFAPVLKRYAELPLGALITKSVSSEVRSGFENPIFVQCSEEAFINAVGLPGGGHLDKKKELEECYSAVREKGKAVIASIFDGDDAKLADIAEALEPVCDAFEINLSCPNLQPGDKFGILVCRDPALAGKHTRAVAERVKKPVIAKLSPGPYIDDRERFERIVLACAEAGADAISAINTIAGGMKIDIHAQKPVLAAKFGGLSGKAIKPIGVGCVYTICKTLKEHGYDLPIIAIGGIDSAADIAEYVQAGASAAQIATYFVDKPLTETKAFLEKINSDLAVLVSDLGFSSLDSMRGAAHE